MCGFVVGVSASQLTRSVAGNVTQGMQLASDLIGVDLPSLFQRLANGGHRDGSTSLVPPAADGEGAHPQAAG